MEDIKALEEIQKVYQLLKDLSLDQQDIILQGLDKLFFLIQHYKDEIEDYEEQIDELESANEDLQEENTDLEKECEDLRDKVGESSLKLEDVCKEILKDKYLYKNELTKEQIQDKLEYCLFYEYGERV